MVNLRTQLQRFADQSRLVWSIPLVVALIGLIGVWQWQQSQFKYAASWRTRATHCVELATQIRLLRSQPRRFDDRVLESHRLVALVEQSAGIAGISLKQLMAIRPEAPQRVRDTSYVETYIHIRLTNLTLQQLAKFPWSLQQNVPGLAIPKMRVWVQSAQSKQWEAELTIIGLAYVPSISNGSVMSRTGFNPTKKSRAVVEANSVAERSGDMILKKEGAKGLAFSNG